MQKPQEVLDSYYLDARCQLLEIAALLDRYDRSCESDASSCENDANRPNEGRIDLMYESLTLLSEREGTANRSERLLNLFSDPE